MAHQPSVFLFDEPLSNLDAKIRAQLRTEIKKLHTRIQSTMIYVTHDQIEAMTMGDRVCVMKDGVIQQTDTPSNIYDNPANQFVASFIGTPRMNFFSGTLKLHETCVKLETSDFAVPLEQKHMPRLVQYENRPITLGVRPESIKVSRRKEAAEKSNDTPAIIETIESIGHESHVHLTAGTHSMIARVNPCEMRQVHQNAPVFIDTAKAVFFDPETTQAI